MRESLLKKTYIFLINLKQNKTRNVLIFINFTKGKIMKKLLKILLVLFGSFWVLYLAMELFFTIPYYTGLDGHAVVKILIGLVLSAGPLYYALKKL